MIAVRCRLAFQAENIPNAQIFLILFIQKDVVYVVDIYFYISYNKYATTGAIHIISIIKIDHRIEQSGINK